MTSFRREACVLIREGKYLGITGAQLVGELKGLEGQEAASTCLGMLIPTESTL